MWVSSTKKREIQKGKTPTEHCNAQKWDCKKKFFNEWIIFAHFLQRIDDGQISQNAMVVKKKGNLLGIKGLNKGEILKQLTSCDEKFLNDDYLKDGVENICNIHM